MEFLILFQYIADFIVSSRRTHEGTCVGQSVGVCGGSGELVKRKRKTPEGTCVGQWIGSG
jgi:hypothetical protein